MRLELTDDEARLLRSVLLDYVSNLRMQITSTELFDLRRTLKRNERALQAIIDRLESPSDEPQ